LVREVFSFWTGHPFDFELWVRTGYWVARGLNPYGVIPPAPGLSFESDVSSGGVATIAYLPFWPLLLAGLYDVYAFLGSPTPLLYYFLLKQPIIICDVLTGYFLYRYVERRGSDKAPFVLKFWLFSPFNILLSGIWGMFDAIPVLFVVLALTVRPGAYRGIWSGLATFAKSIPVIYAIPLSRGPKPLRTIALAVGIPVLASLLAIWLMGWSFSIFGATEQNVVARGGASLSLWEALFGLNELGVLPSSVLGIYAYAGYVWIAGVVAVTLLSYKWFGFDTERGVIRSLLLITLTFLLLKGQVNEQYSLYLFPLLLIDVSMWSPQRKKLLFASVALVFLEVLTNDFLFVRFLAPVYPHADLIEFNLIFPVSAQREVLLFVERMGFCALNVYYFWALCKERHTRTEDQPLLT
jgi:hypothetical protein